MPVVGENKWPHAPRAKLDYTWPWGSKGWLRDGETISEKTFSHSAEIEVTGDVLDPGTQDITAWVQPVDPDFRGTATATCFIVTSEGRKDERTLTVLVTPR